MEDNLGLVQTRKILTEKFPPYKIKVIYFKCKFDLYKELKMKAVAARDYDNAAKLRDLEKDGRNKFEVAVREYYSECK